jgi:hypothetical protein
MTPYSFGQKLAADFSQGRESSNVQDITHLADPLPDYPMVSDNLTTPPGVLDYKRKLWNDRLDELSQERKERVMQNASRFSPFRQQNNRYTAAVDRFTVDQLGRPDKPKQFEPIEPGSPFELEVPPQPTIAHAVSGMQARYAPPPEQPSSQQPSVTMSSHAAKSYFPTLQQFKPPQPAGPPSPKIPSPPKPFTAKPPVFNKPVLNKLGACYSCYSFGQKLAEDIANKLTAAVDPLGVGGDGPKNMFTAGVAQLLGSKPLKEVYQDNIIALPAHSIYKHPRQPVRIEIKPHQPIKTFNPNKHQRT